MIDYQTVSEKLYSLLKGFSYTLQMYDEHGNDTSKPSLARYFYINEEPMMVVIDEDTNDLVLNKNKQTEYEEVRQLVKRLRMLADEYIMSFTIRLFGKVIEPKAFSSSAKEMEEVTESKMTGTIKSSYQMFENVKLIIRHQEKIDENKLGARSRNIKAIYLETKNVQIKFPTNNLNGARALACHLSRGGDYADSVSEAIMEKSMHVRKLREFIRYNKSNGIINESNSEVIELIENKINSINECFRRIQSSKLYALESANLEDAKEKATVKSGNSEKYKDMFTKKVFDPQYETLMDDISKMVEEHDQYYDRLMETLDSEIMINEMSTASDVFVCDEPHAKHAAQLRAYADAIVNNQPVKEFFESVADKVYRRKKLSKLHTKLLSQLVKNMKLVKKLAS